MKKKYQELLNVLLLLFLYLGVFLFPTHVMSSTVNAINLFKEKLFPSIFPFFVLSFLMLNLGISRYISTLLEPFFYRMFHIKGDSIFIIVMSIFSGFPSGPKYIGKLYQEQKITKKESQYLLLFTHFGNPLFILGTCGALLGNVSLAGTIFLCQILSNMIIAIAFRPPKKEKSNLALSNRLKEQYKKEYGKSDFQKRLVRLAIYSIIGFLFSIFLVVYSVVKQQDIMSNLLIAIPLFIAALIFAIGRHYAKLTVLNKIALKEKN